MSNTNAFISSFKNIGSSSGGGPNIGSIIVNPNSTIRIGNNQFIKDSSNPFWNNTSKTPSQVDLNVIGNTQISGKLRCGGLDINDLNTISYKWYKLVSVYGTFSNFKNYMQYPISGLNPNISGLNPNISGLNPNTGGINTALTNPYKDNIDPATMKIPLTTGGNTLYKQNFIYPPLFNKDSVDKYIFSTDQSSYTYYTGTEALQMIDEQKFNTYYVLTVQNPIDIAAAGYILSYLGFIVPSDKRIKKNIETYDTTNALSQIKLLRLTTYQKIDNSSKTEIGFIAQEVYEQLPSSIEHVKNYIPNIYKWVNCSYDPKTQNISFENSFDFSFMNRIQIIDENSKKYSAIVIDIEYKAVIHSTEFIEHPPAIKDRVFIYGTYVEDFMSLNKEIIFSVAIGAIQELEKKVSDLTKRIKALEK